MVERERSCSRKHYLQDGSHRTDTPEKKEREKEKNIRKKKIVKEEDVLESTVCRMEARRPARHRTDNQEGERGKKYEKEKKKNTEKDKKIRAGKKKKMREKTEREKLF